MFFCAHMAGIATASATVVTSHKNTVATNRTHPPFGPDAHASVGKGASHNVGVRSADHLMVLVVVVELTQHVAHGVDACALLVVALDHRPRRRVGVGEPEHVFL